MCSIASKAHTHSIRGAGLRTPVEVEIQEVPTNIHTGKHRFLQGAAKNEQTPKM